PLVLMGLLGGLLFSLFLAWNLTRPMKLLQQGFFRVSQGDLNVRLYSELKPRHDELSDLGRDFDSMVEKLNILISERQQLLYDVSHELRTPLARLQLAIGLAQQNKQNIDSSLQRIELETQRLSQLIGEILSFSNSEAVHQMEEYFDLKDLLKILIEDANYEAKPLGINLVLILAPLCNSIIKGNAEQIRRAIENIIRNAIRFSKEGDEIVISLSEAGKFLHICVRDHGPGVEEHKLSSIFEVFVRIQSPLLGKGYGLGLAIARKVVLAHHGTIYAENADDGGLIVNINLPYWKS
ncbi:MAG: HAMP domain-containing protein, partial [Candidatus Schmidhempelia sp.]|nr:HAMP domain-containing protein [Candidatus Schmidhempelia sp.]